MVLVNSFHCFEYEYKSFKDMYRIKWILALSSVAIPVISIWAINKVCSL